MNPNNPNKNQIVHPEKYGGTIINQPIVIDNSGQHQRHTLQYANQTHNQHQNPQTIIPGTNYNFQNVQVVPDNRKTYTPGQLRQGNVNQQLLQTDIYMMDPHNVNNTKYLKNEPKPHTHTHTHHTHNNNQIHNNQTETYYLDPETGKKVTLQATTYQPQLHAGNNLTTTVVNDTNQYYQEGVSPIIENLFATISPQNDGPNQYNPDPNNDNKKQDFKKSATLMTVKSLANIPYNEYPAVEYSHEPFLNIAGYGLNSYNGKVKNYNEDEIKAIVNYKLNKKVIVKGVQVQPPSISYFSVFDGHGGKKCSDFLKHNLDTYLFNSSFFPAEPIKAIRESFKKAEENFCSIAYDSKNNILLDRSGSCALVMLIINNLLYAINLGDSRALYSYDTGKYLYQISRDHKPNDEVEKNRIESVGGHVYYANKVKKHGKEVELKEENYGKGFTFPYRVIPGKIAVSLYIFLKI